MKKTTLQIIILIIIVILGLLMDSLIFPELTPKEKRDKCRVSQNLNTRFYSSQI
jgi:hypothetical protein